MTAWLHPHATCTGIEAQASRATQAARSVRLNGVQDRVTVRHADLRTLAAAGEDATYDLVTGTPPYFDVTAGALPGSEEAARCLFEYRGGIEAYCAAAAGLLHRPAGVFIVCETSLEIERTYAAAAAAALRVIARVDVVPKAGKPPLFSVFVMCAPDARWHAAASGAADADAGANPFVVSAATFAPRGRSPYAADAGDGADAKRFCGGAGDGDDDSSSDATAPAAARADAGTVAAVTRQDVVVRIVVRDEGGVRTAEYCALLTDMGKPS